MGVRGLTTYISENSRLYLKPHQLCDCYLVVDGNNVAFHLYKWVSERHSAFGGDYDEYYRTVRDFFSMLKTCNVTPIVLFDGGNNKKKVKTTINRAHARLPFLRAFNKGFIPTKFYPLFTKQTFCDVMEDLGIFCIQCDFEADVEIASIARMLNCPVLSYDSDFYIFDVLYIPFSSVCTTPVKFDDSNRYYVSCFIYDVKNFLNKFEGLDKSLLPITAALLGNDYIESATFEKFFGHVILPKNNKAYTQRKIEGIFHWLKKENFESAVKQISNHLESKNVKKFMEAIQATVKQYTSAYVSEAVLGELKNRIGDVSLNKNPSKLNLPPEVSELYFKNRIHKFIIDMITLSTYFTPQQVEYLKEPSCHCPSLELITDIYTLLGPYRKGVFKPLRLFMHYKSQYCAVTPREVSNHLKNVFLSDILKESEEMRLKWFCYIVGVGDNDLEIVPKSDWSIFILSFIYWIKKLNSQITLAHIHALILTAIANQIIQKTVGFFSSHSKFIKSKGNLLAKLKNEPVLTGIGNSFEEMLSNVTLYEKLLVQSQLMPLRQSTEKGTGKAYCISAIHLFACFQSCLYHIMQLNALLNYPLPHLKVSEFYSGTLLFNLYLSIKAKTEVEKYGDNLFRETPNLKMVYAYLSESLCEYSEKTSVVGKEFEKRKSRRNKTSKKGEVYEERILIENHDTDESHEYNDENNPYAILQYGVNY